MITFTLGLSYTPEALYRRAIRMMAGSISTASTCPAPLRTAAATSLPVPAPTTSTSCGRGLSMYGRL